MKKMDDYDYARLSEHVYDKDPDNPVKEGEIVRLPSQNEKGFSEFKVVATHENPDNGYFGAVYVNTETDEVTVAHRGTDAGNWTLNGTVSPPPTIPTLLFNGHLPANKDLATDIGMVVDKTNRQIADAQILTDKAEEYVKNNPDKYPGSEGDHITHVGHSLGGTEAQATAYNNNQKAVTFNAFPAGGLKGLKEGGSADGITNHVMVGDPVSFISPFTNFNEHLGETKLYTTEEQRDKFEGNFIERLDVMNDITHPLHLSEHFMDNFTGSNSVLLNDNELKNSKENQNNSKQVDRFFNDMTNGPEARRVAEQARQESQAMQPTQESKQEPAAKSQNPSQSANGGKQVSANNESDNLSPLTGKVPGQPSSQSTAAGKSPSASDVLKNTDLDDPKQVDTLINGAAGGEEGRKLAAQAQQESQAIQPVQPTPQKSPQIPVH